MNENLIWMFTILIFTIDVVAVVGIYYYDKEKKARLAMQESLMKAYKDQFSILEAVCANELSAGKDASGVYQRVNEYVEGASPDSVMSRFREDFPELKEKDYIFVCCFFAGLSNNLIARISGYPSVPAIYTKKSRYKKMIQNSNSASKEIYLYLLK